MRRHPRLFPDLLGTLSLLLVAAAAPAAADRWDVEDERTIEETFTFAAAAGPNLLVIDNVSGSIRVTGHDGPEVRLFARETLRARSAGHLERARREAGLEIKAEGDAVYLIVDGPFREPDGGLRWRRDLGYVLHYDFEVRLPHRTRVVLRTVNEGDVEVSGVEGGFDVANVNGAVDLEAVAGHGRARTVNGDVAVRFTRSPDGRCDFKTVNGTVDLAFPGDLAADLRFKTMNGGVYTDFDYTPRAFETPEPERRRGRTVWKSLGFGARIGGGGPEMSFETLNGNVYIRRIGP